VVQLFAFFNARQRLGMELRGGSKISLLSPGDKGRKMLRTITLTLSPP
jgi:hypothetical protein